MNSPHFFQNHADFCYYNFNRSFFTLKKNKQNLKYQQNSITAVTFNDPVGKANTPQMLVHYSLITHTSLRAIVSKINP